MCDCVDVCVWGDLRENKVEREALRGDNRKKITTTLVTSSDHSLLSQTVTKRFVSCLALGYLFTLTDIRPGVPKPLHATKATHAGQERTDKRHIEKK